MMEIWVADKNPKLLYGIANDSCQTETTFY